MINGTVVSQGHTKQYHIPFGHIEHRYIQNCTDEVELDRIYQELIGGEICRSPILEQLTLDRIRNIQTNSRVLRDENVLSIGKSNNAISGMSHPQHRRVPKSDEEWQKFERKISQEFKSDNDDANSDQGEPSKRKSHEQNKRLHMANQHRLNANTAFNSKNYQQSIDLYTKSLQLENTSIAQINRAIAHLKLDHFDESIRDCSEVLSTNSKNTKALFCRALSYFAKKQYEETKGDLNDILTINPEDNEAENLFNTITTLTKTVGIGDNQLVSSTSFQIAPLAVEEEEEETHPPMTIVIPERTTNPFDSPSPISFDHPNVNPFQISSRNNNNDAGGGEDDMALGDEAEANSFGNLSDNEDQHISHSINVSPMIDNDSDLPELLDHKPLQTPPMTPPIKNYQPEDSPIVYERFQRREFCYKPEINILSAEINPFSPLQQNTISSDSSMDHRQNLSNNDTISNSNFSPIIKSWLQDLAQSESHRRVWYRSPQPWSIEKLQNDIERFSELNDNESAVEVSKKTLHNGLLDYHYHAECIVQILSTCIAYYVKLGDDNRVIQYATESLQYNTTDNHALMCRAKALRNKEMFLLSYCDNVRLLAIRGNSELTQTICEGLEREMNSIEGETWREKLPNKPRDDDEIYLISLKNGSNFCEENAFEWYQSHADRLYLDACFVLAIRFYTFCIELQPNTTSSYLKRAACYLKVFEPKKAIDDCDYVLKEDQSHFLALYRKASAYKMSHNDRLYESTLEEYLRIQPYNQIVLAEYYNCRREDIPRKKRRIRTPSHWEVNP